MKGGRLTGMANCRSGKVSQESIPACNLSSDCVSDSLEAIWGLVVFQDTAERSFCGCHRAIQHVHILLLHFLAWTCR